MNGFTERYKLAWFTLASVFTLVGLDGAGIIDISKFGYAGIGGIITLVLQYYFRKKPSADKPQ